MAQSETSAGNAGPELTEGLVHGPEALVRAVTALLRSARHEVRLFAPRVAPSVFSSTATTTALGHFAARHARNNARLLVEDAPQLLRDNGRLVQLARRLADSLELREVEDNNRGARDLYVIADRSAYLMQEDVERNEALVAIRTPHETVKLIERFDAAWDRATPLALRTLGL